MQVVGILIGLGNDPISQGRPLVLRNAPHELGWTENRRRSPQIPSNQRLQYLDIKISADLNSRLWAETVRRKN